MKEADGGQKEKGKRVAPLKAEGKKGEEQKTVRDLHECGAQMRALAIGEVRKEQDRADVYRLHEGGVQVDLFFRKADRGKKGLEECARRA